MSVLNSRTCWLTPLVVIGVALGLESAGHAQNRRDRTGPARKAPEPATSPKPAHGAIALDDLADDDSAKANAGSRSSMKKKKKATGPGKSGREKSSPRKRGAGAQPGSTTVTASGGGGLVLSGET